MNHAKRRDANERVIIDTLVAYGCAVQQLNDHGVPDLLVSYRGDLHLLEVKLPLGPQGGVHHHGKAGSKGDMTPAQVKWWTQWKGRPPVIVRNSDEALAAVGVER